MAIDIDARERSLEREKTEWQQKLVDIERTFLKKQAEVDALEPRATFLKQSVEELKSELVRYDDYINQAKINAAKIEAEVVTARGTLDSLMARQKGVEKLTEVAHEEARKRVEAYEEQAKLNIDEKLAPELEKLEEVQAEITEKQASLEILKQEIPVIEHDRQEAIETAALARAVFAEISEDLNTELAKLTSEVDDLKTAKANLLITQTDLERENAALARQNKEFVTYEKIAKQALHTADEALQEREQIVAEREQYRSPAKSFLPPVES